MQLMMNPTMGAVLVACLPFAVNAAASPAAVPFTEDFVADSANWFDNSGGSPLGWSPAGGPDGSSFALGSFNFVGSAPEDTPVIFRAQDEFGSSGGAFEGSWIADGVTEFSAFVQHDAGMPLTFFTRFSGPANFPGAFAIQFVPVPPNIWTEISFGIDPLNPQFVTFEGSDFETVFGNIGHIQIGVSVPEALAGLDQTFTFGVDKPTILPEPTTIGLLAIGLSFGLVRGGRRRR